MCSLLLFCLLSQLNFVGGRKSKVIIRRGQSSTGTDQLELASATCRYNDSVCTHFSTEDYQKPTSTRSCECSCSSQAATFTVFKGVWKCVNNEEFHETELQNCSRTNFNEEQDKDPLKVFTVNQTGTLNIGSTTDCSENKVLLSFQACNGSWIPLDSSTESGFEVTKQWASNGQSYILKINKDVHSQEKGKQGKVIKLVMPCREIWFCLLFKIAGIMECPYSDQREISTPTAHSTTIQGTKLLTNAPFSASGEPVTTNNVLSEATTTKSTHKTQLWKTFSRRVTDRNIKTMHDASRELPVALIAVSGSSGVVVFVAVVFVIYCLICRKENKRSSRGTSKCLEGTTTKRADTGDQSPVVEQTEGYQSLTTAPGGFVERGIYAARYNVLNKIGISLELHQCHTTMSSDQHSEVEEELKKLDYDYALSNALHKNAPKLLQPREEDPPSNNKTPFYCHVLERMQDPPFKEPNQEDFPVPQKKTPYYHVLEGLEEDLPFKESNQEDFPVPQKKAPYYHVLEGPGDLDAHDSHVNNQDHHGLLEESMLKALKSSVGKGSINETHDTDAYYHVLEGAETSETQDDCGYKELQSNRFLDTEYQSLHKYTYVDSAEMQYK